LLIFWSPIHTWSMGPVVFGGGAIAAFIDPSSAGEGAKPPGR
jgi:hypothetical protein